MLHLIRWLSASVFTAAVILTSVGCAIVPTPENSTGIDEELIVKKIKCETREAAKKIVIAVITDPKFASPRNYEVAKQIDKDDRIMQNKAYYRLLDQNTRAALEKYDGTAIAYDFTFTITENNDVRGNLNLLSNLTLGSDALNFSASSQRERKSIINFRFSETLTDLFQPRLVCGDFSPAPNYVYPITGSLGIIDILGKFFRLNEAGILDIRAGEKTSLFAHTIQFTTIISGSVNPKIVITPVGKATGVSDAGILAEAKRGDVHTLIIAISLPADRPINFVGPGGAPLTAARTGKSSAEINAEEQVDFQIYKNRPALLGLGF